MKRFSIWSGALIILSCLFCVFANGAGTGGSKPPSLSVQDKAAIRATLERYRTAWLANNADAVRDVFSKDAVLMPHHGLAPVVGIKAINQFWWPETTIKTTITHFEQTVDETGGAAMIAYVRGRSEVSWTTEDHGEVQEWRNSGNYVAILARQADGRWLISHLIWDDPPNQRVK